MTEKIRDRKGSWNISLEEGTQYIIEIFNELLEDSKTNELRADVISGKMSYIANKKNIKLTYNNRSRNLNFFMKNNYINLSTFLEEHKDLYKTTTKKEVLFIKKNEHWLNDEEWTVL